MILVNKPVRHCIAKGKFEVTCGGRDPSYIVIREAKVLITRDSDVACSTTVIDLCEVSDIAENESVTNCTKTGCVVEEDFSTLDISDCAAKGYTGWKVIEIIYMCIPRMLKTFDFYH